MVKQRHSLSAVLTKARLILADGASYEEVLKNLDIPGWYLSELEHRHIAHPNPDLLALIFQCYGLNAQQVADLQRAEDLTTALFELTISDDLQLAANHHQEMDWPNSAEFAAKHGVIKPTDPRDRNSYADILRCMRLETSDCPIHAASLIYGVSPMAYWQMEAAQIPVPEEIVAAVAAQLQVTDLRPFLEAPDLAMAVERQLQSSNTPIF